MTESLSTDAVEPQENGHGEERTRRPEGSVEEVIVNEARREKAGVRIRAEALGPIA